MYCGIGLLCERMVVAGMKESSLDQRSGIWRRRYWLLGDREGWVSGSVSPRLGC